MLVWNFISEIRKVETSVFNYILTCGLQYTPKCPCLALKETRILSIVALILYNCMCIDFLLKPETNHTQELFKFLFIHNIIE